MLRSRKQYEGRKNLILAPGHQSSTNHDVLSIQMGEFLVPLDVTLYHALCSFSSSKGRSGYTCAVYDVDLGHALEAPRLGFVTTI